MQRILIVAPNWIGDSLLAQPLLARLQQRYPAASIDALAPAWTLRPGDTVTITYPRYGLDAGVAAVVVRKQLSLSTLRVILEVWR